MCSKKAWCEREADAIAERVARQSLSGRRHDDFVAFSAGFGLSPSGATLPQRDIYMHLVAPFVTEAESVAP